MDYIYVGLGSFIAGGLTIIIFNHLVQKFVAKEQAKLEKLKLEILGKVATAVAPASANSAPTAITPQASGVVLNPATPS